MGDFTPTDQQVAILDRIKAGWSFVVMAGAGAGKTSTLAEGAKLARKRGLYLAYNKAIVMDAGGAFPDYVSCMTAHSVAYRSIGYQYQKALKYGALQGWQIATSLGAVPRWQGDGVKLSKPAIASLARRTVKKWAGSTDQEISMWHVPVPSSVIDKTARHDLRATVLPVAKRIWYIAMNPRQTQLRFDHDWYLKLFSMSGPDGSVPQLPVGVIYFDECQDADPVISHIFTYQANAQRIAVGDPQQSIYAWRGAEDAITKFAEQGAPVLPLTTSWRFGPEIADEANWWLDELDAEFRITGNPAMTSVLGPIDPDERHAVLCRTNAGVMEAVMNASASGRTVAMVGGGKEVVALANACDKLYNGSETDHEELVGFDSWDSLVTFVEGDDCDNPTLRTLVRLTKTYEPAEISKALAGCVDERDAQVVASTAHRSKGRQWGQVRVSGDFMSAATPKAQDADAEAAATRAGLRLSYVTVTRARQVLDASVFHQESAQMGAML